jgi:hypothetical protein
MALYRCRKSSASTALLGYVHKAVQRLTFCEDFSWLSQCQQHFLNSQIKSTKFTIFGMRFMTNMTNCLLLDFFTEVRLHIDA